MRREIWKKRKTKNNEKNCNKNFNIADPKGIKLGKIERSVKNWVNAGEKAKGDGGRGTEKRRRKGKQNEGEEGEEGDRKEAEERDQKGGRKEGKET